MSLCHVKTMGSFESLWPSVMSSSAIDLGYQFQVMACCLTAPSHYLIQCWFITESHKNIYNDKSGVNAEIPSVTSRGGGGTRSENWRGCAAGRWKLGPKRSREKLNLGPKRSNSVRTGSFNTPKDRFRVGGWEKIPQKDRVQASECQKRGSKRRHIHITQHRGSTLPGGHLDQYMAQHGRTVKQSYCDTVYVMNLFNYSSGVPIPHLRCILHVHWCKDCETVPEQHWNKEGTVSKSQCTPPQCKQIIFGIKNESKVQDQSSSELTGILTVLKRISGPNLEILTWTGDA